MHPDDPRRYQQQQQGQWYPQPGDPHVPLTTRPDIRIDEPMGSAPFLRQRRVWITLAVVGALVLGVGGWALFSGHREHTASAPMVTSSSAPAVAPSDTVYPAQVRDVWLEHLQPCDRPITIKDDPPPDPYNIMEGAFWVNDADVLYRLEGVTAHGGEDFVRERLTYLASIVVRTQSHDVHAIESGTDALKAGDSSARVDRQLTIKRWHDKYVYAIKHIIKELRAGEPIKDEKVATDFPIEAVCPQ